jgi:16S rRNA (cytosine967-C5)-methyltransferase
MKADMTTLRKHTSGQPKGARFTAIDTLCRLERLRLPVKPLLDEAACRYRLAADDRALAMQLVYGVLRRRQYLLTVIGHLCRHPLTRLAPFVLHGLEVGLFQIFLLDRIPESAAVNETVNAVKAAGLPQRLQGFVNGILRESIRQRATLPDSTIDPGNGQPYLDHPAWLTDRWSRHFGEKEMRRICAANANEPSLVLKVNTVRTTRQLYRSLLEAEGILCHEGQFAMESLVLPDFHGAIPLLPGYDEGLFMVQDEAAQLAPLLVGPLRRGGRYLDACAGLGGKTAVLAEMADDLALRITAIEPEASRFRKMEENLIRLHPKHGCEMRRCTLQEFAICSDPVFDGVLVDAPCSGTGVTGRHPDIRWNRKSEDFPRYQTMQVDLLSKAASLVAGKGVLVYATCSLEPEENQDVIRMFLAAHPDFKLTDPGPLLPPAAHPLIVDRCFFPRPDSSIDGFFAARLERD